MDDEYITTTQAKEILKVSFKTISRWTEAGKLNFITAPSGRKRYRLKDIYNLTDCDLYTNQKQKICYCRVSSSKQMDDLKRQQDFFREKFPTHQLVTDVGSGINWKRKGLKTILEQAMQGHISEVVVAHRDRLSRFAFELLEWILTRNKVKLLVLNEEKEHSTDQELADDILSIVHIYSCRKMGGRRYKNKKNTVVSDSKTEDTDEEVDGDEEVCL
jgi:putative resolvase